MKQVLTSLALLGAVCALNAQTQILNYGFETSDQLPGKVDTVNLYQSWKDAGGLFSYEGTPAHTGEYAFYFYTPAGAGTGNRWERVLRFTDLPLKENTSYRVSFYAQANDDAKLHVAIMRGELNADMPLICAGSGSDNFVQQVTEVGNFRAGEYVRKSMTFWSPSLEIQKEWFNSFKSEGTLPDGVFLRLSFTSEAEYLVDNIVVEEATMAGISFSGDAIKVDFGYPTNGAALAKAAGGTAIVDASAFTVTVDGETVTPESAEINKDGDLHLFLGEDYFLTDETVVSVSYNGSISDLIYSTTVAPESWTNPNCAVLAFENETGYYDPYLDAVSVDYEEAELVASYPINDSFEMPETISEFSFTYNKLVYTNDESPEGAPTAVLKTATGWSEPLAVKEGQETLAQTITFVRTGTEPLAKNTYSVVVENISNSKGVAKGAADEISFEVGAVTVDKTDYTLAVDATFPDAAPNTIPMGWTVNNEGEIRESGSTHGTGPRVFTFTNSSIDAGLYIRVTNSDENEGSATYGDQEDYRLTIPAGPVEIRSLYFAWKGAGFQTKLEVYDADDNTLVADGVAVVNHGCEGITANQTCEELPLRFTSDGGNYIVKLYVLGSGFTELIVGGVKVYTYVETKGDSGDSEIVFQDTFADTDNNVVPAAGKGWEIYDDNVLLEKGSNGSGRSSRVMKLSATTNLTSAYYSRMMGGDGSSYYAIYGNGGEDEPLLTLAAGKHQFTYYAVNWKSDYRMLHFILLDENDEEVFSRTDSIFGNLEGNAGKSLEATRIQYNAQIPADGNYKLKVWMDGEALVGNFTIMKVGSMAVYYKTLLQQAIDAAKAEQEKASVPDFAGTTYTALCNAIEAYSNHDFHAPIEYTNAIADLEALVKAMATRRAEVTTYNQYIVEIPTLLGTVESTKYEALDAYIALKEIAARYAGVSSLDLDDEALVAANQEIVLGYNLLKNMMEECVGLLTAQIVQAATMIADLDEETDLDNSVLIAAGNAISDDQELMGTLKLMLTAAVYKACINGDPFNVFDEEFQQYSTDSLDLSCYIQNADLYTTSIKKEGIDSVAAVDVFPGWKTTILNKSTMSVVFGWSAWSGSESHPITDACVVASWGPTIDMTQELNLLPVGVYSISAGTEDSGDRLEDDSCSVKSTFRYETPAKCDTMLFRNDDRGTYYDLTRSIFPNVTLSATDEKGVYASVKYGAYMRTYQSIISIDQFRLHMTGKLEGFDYAAALAAVKEDISDIKNVVIPEGEPASVVYYNLSGARVAQPEGICIQVNTYADGYVVIKKVFIK